MKRKNHFIILLLVAGTLMACHEEKDKPTPPPTEWHEMLGASDPDFNDGNWRNTDSIKVYYPNSNQFRYIALPWAEQSVTNMPTSCLSPNTESGWKLAMNTCNVSQLDALHMFALYNTQQSKMRFYTYMDELPSTSASSYYVTLHFDNAKSKIDPSSTVWAATTDTKNKILARQIPDLPALATNTWVVAPQTADATGLLGRGWLCYEVEFPGLDTVHGSDRLTVSMVGMTRMITTGTMKITGSLTGDSCQLITPGNNTTAAAMGLQTAGGLFSGIASLIGVVTGVEKNTGGVTPTPGSSAPGRYSQLTTTSFSWPSILTGVLGGLGAICTATGGGIQTGQATGNKVQNLKLKFNVNETGDINTTSTSIVGTNVPPLTTSFSALFREMGGDSPVKKAAADEENNTYTLGAMMLEHEPVIYVSEDVLFYTDRGVAYYVDPYLTSLGNYLSSEPVGVDEEMRYVTFLDPTSIQLKLNTDDRFFPYSDVDSVVVQAYDFVYTDSLNTLPVAPYYQAYGLDLPQLSIAKDLSASLYSRTYVFPDNSNMERIACPASEQLIHADDTLVVVSRSDKGDNGVWMTHRYGGSRRVALEGDMQSYSIMAHPIVYVPELFLENYDNTSFFNHLGVAVVAYVFIKDQEEPVIIANRYLPRFKTFKKSDVATIKSAIRSGSSAQQTTDGKPVDYQFFDAQSDRAIRILNHIQPD
ncbi:MAG: hypothetical protein IKO66_04450 [Paludibacteraceae bacterium]|nr:hypothetical protein [Paludibacteraceae bacterium]